MQSILLLGIVIALASFIQGIAGFGFGLFAIPAFMWLGLSLPKSIALELGVVVCQMSWGVYQYRKHIDWCTSLLVVSTRVLALPLGVLALGILVGLGQNRTQQMVGAVLLGAIVFQWFAHNKSPQCVSKGWGAGVGFISGFLSGLTGLGAVPIVLWVMAHNWSSQKIRGMIWAIFLQTIPLQIALLWWMFGPHILIAFAIGVACFPICVIASALGMKIGSVLPNHHVRTVIFVLLIIIAIASITRA